MDDAVERDIRERRSRAAAKIKRPEAAVGSGTEGVKLMVTAPVRAGSEVMVLMYWPAWNWYSWPARSVPVREPPLVSRVRVGLLSWS